MAVTALAPPFVPWLTRNHVQLLE